MDNVLIAWAGFLAGIGVVSFAWGYDMQVHWAWTVFWGVISLVAIVLTIVIMIGAGE